MLNPLSFHAIVATIIYMTMQEGRKILDSLGLHDEWKKTTIIFETVLWWISASKTTSHRRTGRKTTSTTMMMMMIRWWREREKWTKKNVRNFIISMPTKFYAMPSSQKVHNKQCKAMREREMREWSEWKNLITEIELNINWKMHGALYNTLQHMLPAFFFFLLFSFPFLLLMLSNKIELIFKEKESKRCCCWICVFYSLIFVENGNLRIVLNDPILFWLHARYRH